MHVNTQMFLKSSGTRAEPARGDRGVLWCGGAGQGELRVPAVGGGGGKPGNPRLTSGESKLKSDQSMWNTL